MPLSRIDYNQAFESFFYNEVFIASFTLFLIGSVGTSLYRFIKWIYRTLSQYSVSSVSFSNYVEQDLYRSFLLWLAKNSSSLSSSDYQMKAFEDGKKNQWDESQEDNKKLDLFPGANGGVVFWYKGHFMWCRRVVSADPLAVGRRSEMFVHETIHISTYGTNADIFKELLTEVSGSKRLKSESNFLKIYAPSDMGFWSLTKKANLRSFDSVFLQNDLAQRLLDDVSKFLRSGKYYRDVGVPYRRGYMLYGPAGCGKSSTVSAIATQLNLNIYYLSLSNFYGRDAALHSLVSKVPMRTILLIEDLDAVFNLRNTIDSKKSSITFSGLLNVIDGVASENGRILFMTTNHIDRIDSALLRPGRSDVKCNFERADKSQIAGLFEKFYEASVPEVERKQLLSKLLEKIPEFSSSMAVLQGHFVKYKDDCVGGVENYKEIFESQKSYALDELVSISEEQTTLKNTVSRIGDNLSNWVVRLGLGKFLNKFIEHKLFTIADLAQVGKEIHTLEIQPTTLTERVVSMLNGTKESKEGFEDVTAPLSKKLFLDTFADDNGQGTIESMATEFSEKVSDHHLSVFQVQDYLFDHRLNAQEALNRTDILVRPDLTQESKWDTIRAMTIQDWIKTQYCKCSLSTDMKQKFVDSLTEQQITSVEYLSGLSESDLKGCCSWAKDAQISNFMSAVSQIKYMEEQAKSH